MSKEVTGHCPAILFVCTGNAGRSQMAQALCRTRPGSRVVVHSAGVEPWQDLHPVAVRLLHERGIDVTGQHPKHVCRFSDTPFDWVVTIGPNAREGTPELPGNPRRIHWPISDPAEADGTPQQEDVFRRTLAAIEIKLADLLAMIGGFPRAADLHLAPGISTCVVRPDRFEPERHLPMIAAAGFACIELNCNYGSDDFPWDRPQRVRELARIAGDTGVRVYSVHAEGASLPHADPGPRRTAMDLIKTFADLAAELGALIVPFHAGLPAGMERQKAGDRLRSALDELEEHAVEMPCRFAWENQAAGLSAQQHIAWIRERNPGAFGFVLDTGHANIQGDAQAYLQLAENTLCDLHLNGNAGSLDSHLIPGKGTVPWKGFADKLARARYTGPLMLEIEARNDQDRLPELLREARASVEMIRNS